MYINEHPTDGMPKMATPALAKERSQLRQAMDKLATERVKLEGVIDDLFQRAGEVLKPMAFASPEQPAAPAPACPPRSDLTREIFSEAEAFRGQRDRLEQLLAGLDL